MKAKPTDAAEQVVTTTYKIEKKPLLDRQFWLWLMFSLGFMSQYLLAFYAPKVWQVLFTLTEKLLT